MKEALRLLGVIPSARMRPPLLELDITEREAVRRAVESVRLASPVKVN
jgi:dihydrodipicolinate synthase/N-acetylneuraminate lyase